MNRKEELKRTADMYRTQVKQIIDEIGVLCASFDTIDKMAIGDEERALAFDEILDRLEVCHKQCDRAEGRWRDASRDYFNFLKANAHKSFNGPFEVRVGAA